MKWSLYLNVTQIYGIFDGIDDSNSDNDNNNDQVWILSYTKKKYKMNTKTSKKHLQERIT